MSASSWSSATPRPPIHRPPQRATLRRQEQGTFKSWLETYEGEGTCVAELWLDASGHATHAIPGSHPQPRLAPGTSRRRRPPAARRRRLQRPDPAGPRSAGGRSRRWLRRAPRRASGPGRAGRPRGALLAAGPLAPSPAAWRSPAAQRTSPSSTHRSSPWSHRHDRRTPAGTGCTARRGGAGVAGCGSGPGVAHATKDIPPGLIPADRVPPDMDFLPGALGVDRPAVVGGSDPLDPDAMHADGDVLDPIGRVGLHRIEVGQDGAGPATGGEAGAATRLKDGGAAAAWTETDSSVHGVPIGRRTSR